MVKVTEMRIVSDDSCVCLYRGCPEADLWVWLTSCRNFGSKQAL